MRLIRLELAGIGPFAGKHVIEFANLANNGLFLLEGPTGAGKSTIIDAITFALYGNTATTASTTERMRSAHASPTDPSRVELIFEVEAGLFRLARTPAYQRPKRHGEGLTEEKSSVQLFAISNPEDLTGGELIASRAEEVGHQIGRIVGLSREQFTQTVVLPQGEFTRFLHAKATDRAQVLQRVFGTQLYDKVAQELAGKRRQAEEETAGARQRLETAIGTFAGAARVDIAVLISSGEQGATELAARVEAVVAQLQSDYAHESAALVAATKVRKEAEKHFTQIQLLHERQRQFAAASLRQQELAATEEHFQLRVQQLAQAQAAAPVITAATALETATQELELAAAQLQDSQNQLAAISPQCSIPQIQQLQAADAGAMALELQAEAGRLEHVVALEEGLATRRAEIAATLTQLKQDQGAYAHRLAQLKSRPAQQAELAAKLTANQLLAASANNCQAAVDKAKRHLELLADVARFRAAATEAQAQREAAAVVAAAAAEHAHQVRSNWYQGLAGELAATLKPGVPCLVCGSQSHPAPAISATAVSRADVEAAAKTETETSAKLAGTLAKEESAQARMREAISQAESLDEAEAQREMQVAQVAFERASEASAQVEALAQQLAAFNAQTEAIVAANHAFEKDLHSRNSEITQKQAAVTADENQVIASCDSYPTVSQRHNAIVGQSQAFRAMEKATQAYSLASKQHQEKNQDLTTALVAGGFASVKLAQAAEMNPVQIEQLGEQIRQFHFEREQVAASLAQLADVAGTAPAPIEQAQQAFAVAEASYEAAVVSSGNALSVLEAATQRANQVNAAQQAVRHQLATVAPLIRVANLVNAATSDAARRVELRTYVLMRRFEEVLTFANERLESMTNGRFRLERTDERQGGSLKVGLGIKVVDNDTDSARKPVDISGGESFVVSLALALGLVDVVQAETGGIHVETMFIDEGFGSLDAETLNAVLETLGQLRASGRAVGVVSHVDTLKQAIPDRIEIRRLPAGGSTITTVCT